jgi:hypothetical protein
MNIQSLQKKMVRAAQQGNFVAVEDLVSSLTFTDVVQLDSAMMRDVMTHYLSADPSKNYSQSKFFNIAAYVSATIN